MDNRCQCERPLACRTSHRFVFCFIGFFSGFCTRHEYIFIIQALGEAIAFHFSIFRFLFIFRLNFLFFVCFTVLLSVLFDILHSSHSHTPTYQSKCVFVLSAITQHRLLEILQTLEV